MTITKLWLMACMGLGHVLLSAQTGNVSGTVTGDRGEGLEGATVSIPQLQKEIKTHSGGIYEFRDLPHGTYELQFRLPDFEEHTALVTLNSDDAMLDVTLEPKAQAEVEEVVISGTMKEVSRLDSPVPVEVYTAKFFRANPTPSIFDALQHVNGVRPQLNCSICNTGDIHINGLEGPYTMILVDGMPIVSGLSTVYGLSGIPQALVERVEIVKGPASTLYGSEAVGGIINIITKRPGNAPLLSLDTFATSWGEVSTEVSAKLKAGNKAQSLLGLSYFNYQYPKDNNGDHFTDVTLQDRISLFNKWNFDRPHQRILSLAGRFVYEDRWGGEMNWTKKDRGGDLVYGESIYTRRWELFGVYQLPLREKFHFQFSANGHYQDSVYGTMAYLAEQYIAFGQLTWFRTLGRHELLAGLTYRYTWLDDNTPATASVQGPGQSKPAQTRLPGVFMQDEINLSPRIRLLLGLRYDYNSLHGSILAPRINAMWTSSDKNTVLRVSGGNGYRVAHVFTEDHAALTGARDVVMLSSLKPETSWNGNINFVRKMVAGTTYIGLDATAFYTYFSNKIIADYDRDPNLIIYDNLRGHAVSRGISLNLDLAFSSGLKILAGATALDVYRMESGKKSRQLFTENFTGVWNIAYQFKRLRLSVDYTGNLYGPMRLPLLSETDPRSPESPWWSLQNIQLTKKIGKNTEVYGGVKNLLNWTPNKGNPFIIARSHDPFDKEVQFGADGKALVTAENPFGLTFDPSYVYGPNQGIRGFLGFRYLLYR